MALKPVKTSSSKNIVMFGPVGASVSVSDKYIWEDRMGEGGAELVQIFISFDSSRIYSLQFQYFENGKHVLSEKHGGNSGTNYHAIRFDYPKEYITSVIGSFKHAYDCNGITSITFVTNLSTYGPFGDSGSTSKTSTSFEFNLGNARRFCKFFGASIDNNISSIGVYVDALGNPDIQQKQCGQSVEENQLELYSPY